MKLSEIKIEPLIDTIQFRKIPDEVYFSDKYSNYISNSRLSLLSLHPKNPDKFFEGLKVDGGYSLSLSLGSAVHECVLQPEYFYIVDEVDKPTAKAGAMADELYHANGRAPSYQEMIDAAKKIGYYASSFNPNKADKLRSTCNEYWRKRCLYEHSDKLIKNKTPIYLDVKSRDIAYNCIKSLSNNKNIQNLLKPDIDLVGNEQAILMDIKVTCPDTEPFIFHLKSKLDNYSIDTFTNEITVNDIKTTSKYVNMFKSAIKSFKYNREIAMYSWLLGLYASKEHNMIKPTVKGNFLVVETFGDFNSKVYPMDNNLFKTGFEEFKHLIKLVAFYCTLPEYVEFREYFGANL